MNEAIPEFGMRETRAAYMLRPGSYGVILDARERIALVSTPMGEFLPGGGRNADESPEQALHREVMEECGLTLRIQRTLGMADELVFARAEGGHFRKRGSFFLATALAQVAAAGEADHRLVWLTVSDALTCLTHHSHRWAVRRAPSAAP